MKESEAFKVLELAGGISIAHDDKLLIRGQKSEVGLSVDWRDCVEVQTENGEPVVVNWVLPGLKWGDPPQKVLDPEKWLELPSAWERSLYRPQPLRGLDLGEGVSLFILNNQVDIRMTRLFDNLGSRYRSALDTMLDMERRGILKYSPRKDDPTDRNRTEAVRNRLWRKIKPTEYEHDILFAGDLGRAIWADLRKSDKVAAVTDGTVYVKGFQRYKGIVSSAKVYDIGLRDGEEPGSYFKLETTLYKSYFKSEGIGIRELTEQPDIQERMLDRLAKDVGSVLKLCGGNTLEMLQAELNFTGGRKDRRHTDIAKALLDRKDTLTERVRDLERRVDAIERRLGPESKNQ